MVNKTQTDQSPYIDAFEWAQKNLNVDDPSWTHTLRRKALDKFNALGFLISRRNNEEWKYTDIRRIASHQFEIHSQKNTTKNRLAIESIVKDSAHLNNLVFVNGSFSDQLSSVASIPTTVHIGSLSNAIKEDFPVVREHYAAHAKFKSNAFIALNTALVNDGAFIYIPNNTEVTEPIHLSFITTSDDKDIFSNTRVLIVTGTDSKATIVETYQGTLDREYFTNSVTEVALGPGSAVKYYKIQRQCKSAFHVTNTEISHQRNSSFSSVNIDLGGSLVRNNLNAYMGGEGSSCKLNGLYMTTGSQHVDNQIIIDHAKPHTVSKELYKGILNEKSRTVFHGSIIVRKGAVKVDARQEDKNLLLSNQAEADTKPAFWIYCDDVKCAHGAACGQIDDEALFYMQSRGLDESLARRLLITGFVSEIIDGIEDAPLRSHIEYLVSSTLKQWLQNT